MNDSDSHTPRGDLVFRILRDPNHRVYMNMFFTLYMRYWWYNANTIFYVYTHSTAGVFS